MLSRDVTVSLIVTVYNAEKYLVRCIESIQQQTNSNWELIIIDDGSKDSSSEICSKYEKNDSRIRYFYQENQGVSVARNNGIDQANGEIVSFVDADDIVTENMVQLILDNWDDKMDILLFDYYRVEKGKREIKKSVLKDGVCTSDDLILNTCFVFDDEASQNQNNATPWAKAFRKNLLVDNNIYFDRDIFLCEDRVFNLRCYAKAYKVRHVSIPIYEYRINELSVTAKTNCGEESYVKRIVNNFKKYEGEVIPILFEREKYNKLYNVAIYNEYMYILKLILWASEAVDSSIKQQFWNYCDEIANDLGKIRGVKDVKAKDALILWLCCHHMYKVVEKIVGLMKKMSKG